MRVDVPCNCLSCDRHPGPQTPSSSAPIMGGNKCQELVALSVIGVLRILEFRVTGGLYLTQPVSSAPGPLITSVAYDHSMSALRRFDDTLVEPRIRPSRHLFVCPPSGQYRPVIRRDSVRGIFFWRDAGSFLHGNRRLFVISTRPPPFFSG